MARNQKRTRKGSSKVNKEILKETVTRNLRSSNLEDDKLTKSYKAAQDAETTSLHDLVIDHTLYRDMSLPTKLTIENQKSVIQMAADLQIDSQACESTNLKHPDSFNDSNTCTSEKVTGQIQDSEDVLSHISQSDSDRSISNYCSVMNKVEGHDIFKNKDNREFDNYNNCSNNDFQKQSNSFLQPEHDTTSHVKCCDNETVCKILDSHSKGIHTLPNTPVKAVENITSNDFLSYNNVMMPNSFKSFSQSEIEIRLDKSSLDSTKQNLPSFTHVLKNVSGFHDFEHKPDVTTAEVAPSSLALKRKKLYNKLSSSQSQIKKFKSPCKNNKYDEICLTRCSENFRNYKIISENESDFETQDVNENVMEVDKDVQKSMGTEHILSSSKDIAEYMSKATHENDTENVIFQVGKDVEKCNIAAEQHLATQQFCSPLKHYEDNGPQDLLLQASDVAGETENLNKTEMCEHNMAVKLGYNINDDIPGHGIRAVKQDQCQDSCNEEYQEMYIPSDDGIKQDEAAFSQIGDLLKPLSSFNACMTQYTKSSQDCMENHEEQSEVKENYCESSHLCVTNSINSENCSSNNLKQSKEKILSTNMQKSVSYNMTLDDSMYTNSNNMSKQNDRVNQEFTGTQEFISNTLFCNVNASDKTIMENSTKQNEKIEFSCPGTQEFTTTDSTLDNDDFMIKKELQSTRTNPSTKETFTTEEVYLPSEEYSSRMNVTTEKCLDKIKISESSNLCPVDTEENKYFEFQCSKQIYDIEARSRMLNAKDRGGDELFCESNQINKDSDFCILVTPTNVATDVLPEQNIEVLTNQDFRGRQEMDICTETLTLGATQGEHIITTKCQFPAHTQQLNEPEPAFKIMDAYQNDMSSESILLAFEGSVIQNCTRKPPALPTTEDSTKETYSLPHSISVSVSSIHNQDIRDVQTFGGNNCQQCADNFAPAIIPDVPDQVVADITSANSSCTKEASKLINDQTTCISEIATDAMTQDINNFNRIESTENSSQNIKNEINLAKSTAHKEPVMTKVVSNLEVNISETLHDSNPTTKHQRISGNFKQVFDHHSVLDFQETSGVISNCSLSDIQGTADSVPSHSFSEIHGKYDEHSSCSVTDCHGYTTIQQNSSTSDSVMELSDSQICQLATEDFDQPFNSLLPEPIHETDDNFGLNFNSAQSKSIKEIERKRTEGEKLVDDIIVTLVSFNKQLLKMKREMETMRSVLQRQHDKPGLSYINKNLSGFGQRS